MTNELDQFVARYISMHEDALLTTYDANWPSECYAERKEDGENVHWKPVIQNDGNVFTNVEAALNITLNKAYCDFFTRYYSHNLPAIAPRGNCELLQAWNKDDFERLQQNTIGHLMMKARLKQAPTLFFAVTDEEDFILSVLNSTGEVVLEQVGQPPKEVIAPDLPTFIAGLAPR